VLGFKYSGVSVEHLRLYAYQPLKPEETRGRRRMGGGGCCRVTAFILRKNTENFKALVVLVASRRRIKSWEVKKV
jgi:hypothetical protein